MAREENARSGNVMGRRCAASTFFPVLLPGLVALAAAGLSWPCLAAASGLLAPAAGTADAATGGSTVAEPLSALGALFANPAGVAGFEEAQVGTSLGLAYGRGVVEADVPAGYHAENEVLVPFLESAIVVPRGDWSFALGMMGTSGARFDYGPRPSLGVDDGFFSESGIFSVPATAAWRVTDRLWLGAELMLLHGSTHLRFSREVAEAPGAPTPFRFTVSGFGVQGMVGFTWKPLEAWSVGLSCKPPGRIWADGDTRFGAGKQRVNLELEAPLEAALGVTRSLGDRWRLSYSLRFIDTSVLATSYLRFEKTPSADSPFVADANDEWRHAIGLEYAWSGRLALLAGFAKANGIVGSRGTSPATYDSRDLRLTAGLRWTGDAWTVDGGLGYVFAGSRRVDADEAMVFPGRYDSKPAYLLSLMLTKAL